MIDDALKDMQPSSVNACWSKLLPEAMHRFTGFQPSEEDDHRTHVAKIMALARQVVGEGFSDLQESEVEELLGGA